MTIYKIIRYSTAQFKLSYLKYGGLAILLILSLMNRANACSCRFTPPEEMLEQSKHVLIVEVNQIETVVIEEENLNGHLEREIMGPFGANPTRGYFEVLEVIKGSKAQIPYISAYDQENGGMCHKKLKQTKYVIFEKEGNQPVTLSLCSWVKEADTLTTFMHKLSEKALQSK
ncbi:MAG: hypothetical protein HWE27_07650 [Gammaproteobacteria bacterium]|nr:hypothetical protein [Gammaproteobacteria bacterium]